MNKNKKQGIALMLTGAVIICIALIMVISNVLAEKRAKDSLQIADILADYEVSLRNEKATQKNEVPDYVLNPETELPAVEIEEETYIGRLTLHTLDLSLPVMDDWDYRKLKISPCRYKGSPYSNDFIIAAHYYDSHFGAIDKLQSGDKITFNDTVGNSFEYEVICIEFLEETDVELMTAGDWDLTLFTCTYDTESRVTVRAKRIMRDAVYASTVVSQPLW